MKNISSILLSSINYNIHYDILPVQVMRRLIQHSIILTNEFTAHTLWVWATVCNHFYYLIFGLSKIVEHQNLTNNSKQQINIIK